MRAVFLGATRGLGRALARLMAARGDRIFLLGRQEEDLTRSGADLQARGASGRVAHAPCDLLRPEGFGLALDHATRELGGLDAVVITAAEFVPQPAVEDDGPRLASMLDLDLTKTVLFCEEARRRLLSARGGTLCVFGSIAGDRPRLPNYGYGAAKAGLAHYLDGLDLRYRSRGLRVVLVKPGFARTTMTDGIPEPPFAADAEVVARAALRGLDRGSRIVYAPRFWWCVALALRLVPRRLLRRSGP